MNTPSQQQSLQSSRPPLRRAVYINISNLTSAYDVDHKKLEKEIFRVKTKEGKKFQTKETHHLPIDEEREAFIPQKRLNPPRTGFNLCVLVGKVTIVVDKLRVDRSRVRLAEVQVGDETGTVSFRARDNQIDLLNEVSKRSGAVVLRNCTLELFQGRHIRLAVTKWGKLNVFPDDVPSTPPPPSRINSDKNFSLVDLSLVATEMIKIQPHEKVSNKTETKSERKKPSNTNKQTSQSSHGSRRAKAIRKSAGNKPYANEFSEMQRSDQKGYPSVQVCDYNYVHNDGYNGIYNYSYSNPWSNIMEMQQFYGNFPIPGHHLPIPHHHRSNQENFPPIHPREPMLRPIQPDHFFVPSVVTSPTFDTADFPSLPSIARVQGSYEGGALSNLEDTSTSHHDVGPWKEKLVNTSNEDTTGDHDVGPWRGKVPNTSNEDSTTGGETIGAINSHATTFAPSYMASRTGQTIHPPAYQGYNLYDQRGRAFYQQQQHHPIYSQNTVYVPVPVCPTVLPDQEINLYHQNVKENK